MVSAYCRTRAGSLPGKYSHACRLHVLNLLLLLLGEPLLFCCTRYSFRGLSSLHWTWRPSGLDKKASPRSTINNSFAVMIRCYRNESDSIIHTNEVVTPDLRFAILGQLKGSLVALAKSEGRIESHGASSMTVVSCST